MYVYIYIYTYTLYIYIYIYTYIYQPLINILCVSSLRRGHVYGSGTFGAFKGDHQE